MPTKRPRIVVNLDPETHAVLVRFARESRQSVSKAVGELLDCSAPALARFADLAEQTREAYRYIGPDLVTGMQAAVEDLRGILDRATAEHGEVMSRLRGTAQPGAGGGGGDARHARGAAGGGGGGCSDPPTCNTGGRSPDITE